MDLSNKIIKLRKSMSLSQEELSEKLGVSRQAVSKWESGQSIPDIDKIILISEFFGVSTDYLLKDTDGANAESSASEDFFQSEPNQDTPQLHTVDKFRASTFITAKYREARIIALAVAIFILSPVTLIALLTSTNTGFIGETPALAIGLVVLFPLVSLGVGLCIYSNFLTAEFRFKGENYKLDDAALRILTEEKSELRKNNIKFYIIGIALTILSPLALILYSVLAQDDTKPFFPITLIILFVMVSIGVGLLTYAGIKDEALETLDFDKKKSKGLKTAEDIYWTAIPFIYLLISFLSGRWDITWIIWPFAPIIPEIASLISRRKK